MAQKRHITSYVSRSPAFRFLKVEMKRAGVTCEDMAERLQAFGLRETRDSVAAKLKPGTFATTFMLAFFAALKLGSRRLGDISISD
jgi:hypothetical protein